MRTPKKCSAPVTSSYSTRTRIRTNDSMKRPGIILLAGLALAALGYAGMYRAGTADSCCLVESKTPELAWLKQEFHLSDAEFTRISQMHEQYLSGCAERCHQID